MRSTGTQGKRDKRRQRILEGRLETRSGKQAGRKQIGCMHVHAHARKSEKYV